MTTLTDRYVDATVRRLPPHQRPDIERELRTSIADALDDRIEAGESPAEAETAVLTALGDPSRLAAGYADRPLHLIGPGLYVDYIRVLTALLATVVPTVTVIVCLVDALGGDPVLDVIGSTLGAAFTTATNIAVWVTLFFAIIERTPALRWTPSRHWTPTALPTPPSRRARFTELIVESIAFVLFTTFILLAPVLSPKSDAAGNPIPVLSPWLWDTGMVYVFIALVVASLGASFVRYYAHWSAPVAVVCLLVELAPPILMIWLAANDHIANQAFLDTLGWPDTTMSWVNRGLIVIAAIAIVSAFGETARRARVRG